jgi:hypothetical protein
MIKITTCKKVAEYNGGVYGIVDCGDKSIYICGDLGQSDNEDALRIALILNGGDALEIKEIVSKFKRNKELDDEIMEMLIPLTMISNIKNDHEFKKLANEAYYKICTGKKYFEEIVGSSFEEGYMDEDYFNFIKKLGNIYINEKKHFR